MDGRFFRSLVTICNKINISPDIYDLEMLWDETLTYQENRENILKHIRIHNIVPEKRELQKIASHASYLDNETLPVFLTNEINVMINDKSNNSCAWLITREMVNKIRKIRSSQEKGKKRKAMTTLIRHIRQSPYLTERQAYLFMRI